MYDTILVLLSTCLLVTLGADEHDHPFALEVWYIVRFAVLGQVSSEASQQEFALLFEHDRASAEEDVSLHFVAFFEELDGVFELEVIIVVIRLRTEPDLLHLLFFLVSLRLFLFFLLCVEELLVVNDTAYRRVGGRRYFDQIKVLVVRYTHSLLKRVDTLFYIVADKAHLCDTANLIVNTMRVFFNHTTATRSGLRSCYSFNCLWLIILLLVRAQFTLPSKKRTKLLLFFHIRKNFGFFLHFFLHI